MKTHPQKLLRNTQFFSSLLPRTAQTVQTEEFMFQNVAYRPTVYKTGDSADYEKRQLKFDIFYEGLI